DPLGRLLTKIVIDKTRSEWGEIWRENYLYDGQQEIGAITPQGVLKNLKVLGLSERESAPSPIVIQLNNKIYPPIFHFHGNICRLIDPAKRAVASRYEFTAFGEVNHTANDENPWCYAAKRLDPELNLISFGKRYYDPELARWLSPDPAGFLDSLNLYQYALNNPYRY